MKRRPRVGDLVCYNAAGMKPKTLGLVLDIKSAGSSVSIHREEVILIQWCVTGKLMPRIYQDYMNRNFDITYLNEPAYSGSIRWYKFGDWFEIVK